MSELKKAVKSIQKEFGEGSVVQLGEQSLLDIPVIPTGSFEIDDALGVGGFPLGRIVEIYGPESSGKTTIAIHAVAQAQRMGLNTVFIDVEHAFDPSYAKAIGVDVDNMLFSQPDSGEEALEIADRLTQTGEVGLIVVDSVAALVPRAELNGEMGDSHIGLQARLMSQALRKLKGAANRTGTCIIFINQLREKVGVMFGSPEVTPGGRALKFYASVRLDIRRKEMLKEDGLGVGNKTKIKVVKNKVAPPFREKEIIINYGEGIDIRDSLLTAAEESELLITKGSHWYTDDGEHIANSKPNARIYLRENPEFFDELTEKVRAARKL